MKSLLGTSALVALFTLGSGGMVYAQAQHQQPNAGSGANIHVQEPAPNVTVHEPSPNVKVQQPKPNVVVKQPEPNVMVKQPKPDVTVQQPQPQVTVQQPKPDVTVREAKPNVQVERQGQANVNVNRTGQTNVKVKHEAQQSQQQKEIGQQQGQNQHQQGEQQQQAANQGMPLVAAKKLIGTEVKTTNGQNAGEIKNLLIGPSGKVQAAVIEWGGGIFGIGSKENVLSINKLRMAGNKAQVDMTKDQIKNLPAFSKNNTSQYGAGWRAYK